MTSSDAIATPSLSILLVDDSPIVREATAGMLADAGHRVHAAPDGMAALSFLQERGPVDLMITDISMPEMDGLTLVEEVQVRWPGVRVLLVSGRAQPPGTRAFMPKPFDWDDLAQAVSVLVNKPGI